MKEVKACCVCACVYVCVRVCVCGLHPPPCAHQISSEVKVYGFVWQCRLLKKNIQFLFFFPLSLSLSFLFCMDRVIWNVRPGNACIYEFKLNPCPQDTRVQRASA